MKKLLLSGAILLFIISSVKAQNSISGYIVSLETAKPIANATVFLNNRYNLPLKNSASFRVTSDSTGFYKITGIKTGYYIINAWTAYRIMNQRYGMVIESNKFVVNRNMDIDFVFSENAFKMDLSFKYKMHRYFNKKTHQYFKNHPSKVFGHPPKRSSDLVARQADRPQIYFNSQRDTVGAYYIEKLNDIKK